MPKMARNRSALHNVLAQGASNRDITVYIFIQENTFENVVWKMADILSQPVFRPGVGVFNIWSMFYFIHCIAVIYMVLY